MWYNDEGGDEMITEKAYAKINLFLDVLQKRVDNYHDIVSIMQTVDWYDLIEIEKSVSGEININTNSPEIPLDSNNTVYRAARLFLDAIHSTVGLDIRLKKNIPIAAGMAGGSADAAAVLRAANRLFDAPLSLDQLLALAGQIGADVPFCLLGGTREAKGIGEKLEEISSCPDCFIVCAKLGDGVSTPEAYRGIDEYYLNFESYRWHAREWHTLVDGLDRQSVSSICEGMYNVFEETVSAVRPEVCVLKQLFSDHGGVAMMSGSGPSVFAIFQNAVMAEKACSKAQALGAKARICRPISPV